MDDGTSRKPAAGRPQPAPPGGGQSGPWYRDGLRFNCTQCGNCCSGEPGYVWATREERRAIAEHLGLDLETFTRRYTRKVGNRYSLRERRNGRDLDCVFLEHHDGKRICGLYTLRPLQCRTWPFWSENLKTRSAWQDTAEGCPGIGRGKHYDFVDIEIQRTRRFH